MFLPLKEADENVALIRSIVSAVAIVAIGIALMAPVPAKASDLDMRKIFRCSAKDEAGIEACDQARDLILDHCTACHAFVPIVMQQFEPKGWDGLFARHRARVSQLSEQQLVEMKAYLAANFNPRYPPPELPADLLGAWTSN